MTREDKLRGRDNQNFWILLCLLVAFLGIMVGQPVGWVFLGFGVLGLCIRDHYTPDPDLRTDDKDKEG
jgi:hypothetical protein